MGRAPHVAKSEEQSHPPPSFHVACLQTSVSGWLEAFAAHPRIGDVEGLKRKFGAFGSLSNAEQAVALAEHNDRVFQVRKNK